MRYFVASVVVAVVGFGVPAAVVLSKLAGPAGDPAAVLLQADRYYALLGVLKYVLGVLVLAAADVAVLRERWRGATRVLLLWAPFAFFLAAALVQWGFVGDAYLRFARDYQMGGGRFSAAVLYMALGFPLAFVFTLLNQGIVTGLQERGAGGTPSA